MRFLFSAARSRCCLAECQAEQVVPGVKAPPGEARNRLRADFRRFGAGMSTFKVYMMQAAGVKLRTVAGKYTAYADYLCRQISFPELI